MTDEALLINERQIAVPGETIAKGMGFLPGAGTFREGDCVVAGRLGMVDTEGKVIKLLPLSGKYLPRLNDKVIGKVIDVLLSGWRLDIAGPYSAVLSLKDATAEFIARGADLTQYYALGDCVVCKISNVTSQKLIDVTMRGPGLRKISGGRTIAVSAMKVPRIIGKEGSMVSMIKTATGCDIHVGQNGLVWLNGQPQLENIAVEAIRMIEDQAHLPGLTERVKKFLADRTAGMEIPAAPAEPVESAPRERFDREERRPFRDGDRRGPPRGRGGFRGERRRED